MFWECYMLQLPCLLFSSPQRTAMFISKALRIPALANKKLNLT
jgi:hypothetical protein